MVWLHLLSSFKFLWRTARWYYIATGTYLLLARASEGFCLMIVSHLKCFIIPWASTRGLEVDILSQQVSHSLQILKHGNKRRIKAPPVFKASLRGTAFCPCSGDYGESANKLDNSHALESFKSRAGDSLWLKCSQFNISARTTKAEAHWIRIELAFHCHIQIWKNCNIIGSVESAISWHF